MSGKIVFTLSVTKTLLVNIKVQLQLVTILMLRKKKCENSIQITGELNTIVRQRQDAAVVQLVQRSSMNNRVSGLTSSKP